MLDIKYIKDNATLVKDTLIKRFQKGKLQLVDEIIKKHDEWSELRKESDERRKERNILSNQINTLKKEKKDASKVIKLAKDLPSKIEGIDNKISFLEKEIRNLQLKLPNILHKSVPIGEDSTKNKVIRKCGTPVKPKFNLKNHVELLEDLGIADFESSRMTSGKGFNYLKKEAAILDHALQKYAVDFLLKKRFDLIVPPMLLNYDSLLGALNGLEDFENVVYKIENEDLYLIGTAEHSLVTMFKNNILNEKELPIKVCAVTPCFRKEIGAHGVDTKGLFRMHQFNKVEQVVLCKPGDSFKMLEEMQKITEAFFKTLKIPFQVIEICSGDLGAKFAKQYDIEAWFPRQNAYKEVTSAGNCTNFQSQALNIKYIKNGEKEYPHILNNTMVATSRAMVAIFENFQQKDGSIKIPSVLHKYTGFKKIENERRHQKN